MSKPDVWPEPRTFEGLSDLSAFLTNSLLDSVIRQVVLERLCKFDGHRRKTAKSLGVGVRTLGIWIKKWQQV